MKLLLFFVALLIINSQLLAQVKATKLTIHLRGVSESKISLLGMTPSGLMKPFTEHEKVLNGQTVEFAVPADKLPGEFVIRFDYKEKKESTPYPSEKYFLISDQDLELWVSPVYCNNPDSTWFQEDEKENQAYWIFMNENGKRKEKLGLLQQFLMAYDDTGSEFYQSGIREYETRRKAYNDWLGNKETDDRKLFASSLYRFNYVPQIPWEGSEEERLISLINHYFDGMDLGNPSIIRTTRMNDWMNAFVNLHVQMATTVALRDSLFPAAARTAIEKARKGHPDVYGWMVDYFYRGFESNNIPAGMKVLQAYLDDPNCKTSKRKEIERRLQGMTTLVAGKKAPDIQLKDRNGNLFSLYDFHPETSYILLLFWSADCSHCVETADAIYPWSLQPDIRKKLSVVAVSLDETETELKAWEKKRPLLSEWNHLLAPEGVRSTVANDYYILATPVMVILDVRSKEIISLPNTLSDLQKALR